MVDLPVFHSEDTLPVVAIILAVLMYLLYWYGSQSRVLQRRLLFRVPEPLHSLIKVLWIRTTGMFFLGFIPALVYYWFLPLRVQVPLFSWKMQQDTFFWIASVGTIMILITYLARHGEENLKNYPQIRIHPWPVPVVFLNFVSWFGFLLAYEFLFRGILFFSVYEAWGFWPSITINTALYALVHFPKGMRETIGAIPFGLLMCFITFNTGSIWAAFGIHLVMALANDHFARLAHSEMQAS